MNAVKTVFLEVINLLCRFHIDENVKAKCKTPVEFDKYHKKFEIVCLPWSIFVDFVNQIWLIPHKEKFVKTWMNKMMHLGNTTTNKYENCKLLLLLGFTIEWIKIIGFIYLVVYFICRIESPH
ncbi:hypothetical protein GmHk_04G011882 [Glycine max]|nr:hypothetical protein GmHk_04G011882 [Glycine max]